MQHFSCIDWEEQWAAHAIGYREGYLHVDLSEYASLPKTLKLKPGPGFGDLSHPTTRLVLRLMGSIVKGKHVVDIGCGSGILSLAASALGAVSVCGVDIDEEALSHSRLNSCLNGMAHISFLTPEKYCCRDPVAVLMNMIQTEQSIAWHSLPSIHETVETAITSGILLEERSSYLRRCREWGWELVDEQEEQGWLGFVFSRHLA